MSILKAVNLNKIFKIKNLLIPAVEDLNFEVVTSDFFALVGESGSGKSTLARLMLRLIRPDSGEILFKNKNIWKLNKEELRIFNQSVSVVFQDPYSSLNPRMKNIDIVEEPNRIHKNFSQSEIQEKIIKLFREVGLDRELLNRYPHQLSGGQRQRVAIARALILEPEVLIADEPLSALDISLQASILHHLVEIQQKRNLSILLITHDLNIVRAVSKKIAVMHLGRIVEEAETKELFREPLHPYTKILINSIPGFHRRQRNKIPKISADDRFSWTLKGCRFFNRCIYKMEICKEKMPDLKKIDGRKVRCFLYWRG